MTSDERHEVAATMRVISGEGVHDLTLGEVLNSILTDGAPRPATEMAILARLADLIDPTCEFEPMPAYVPSHRFFRWRCKTCGAVCFAPLNATRPRYCPHCGSRVGMTAREREVS